MSNVYCSSGILRLYRDVWIKDPLPNPTNDEPVTVVNAYRFTGRLVTTVQMLSMTAFVTAYFYKNKIPTTAAPWVWTTLIGACIISTVIVKSFAVMRAHQLNALAEYLGKIQGILTTIRDGVQDMGANQAHYQNVLNALMGLIPLIAGPPPPPAAPLLN